MKLYKIRDWDKLFENNRTRDMKRMSWVPVPNRHDGDGYTCLVSRKNGAAIYGAWIVILQVASKCDPRGTLLRAPSKPHDAASISRITRIPEADIQAALIACSDETDWLEVEELAKIPQEGAENRQEGAEIPQATDEEWKGREQKGMEGKKEQNLCEERLRLAKLFNRRPTTKWSEKEMKLWKAITPINSDDLELVEKFFATPGSFHRKDLETLLGNWGKEVDRAGQVGRSAEPKQIQEHITIKLL